jgi:hypothetical protein
MKKTILLLLSLAPAALAADVTGRFEAGAKYEEPASHAPANVSRMFARQVPRAAANAIDIPSAGGSGMIVWTIPSKAVGAPLATRLTTPTGNTLQPGDRGSLARGLRRFAMHDGAEVGVEGAQEVMHVLNADAAAYRLSVDVPLDVDSINVVVAEPESRVAMSTWAAPLSRQPGQPVTLHAELREGDAPLTGARVTARLAAPNGRAFGSLELTEVSAGVYRAVLPDLPAHVAGAWQVRFDAHGLTADGTRYARTGSGELVAERGAARLGAIRTEVVGEMLRVTAPADVRIAGSYRFDVIVADDARNALAWGEAVRKLENGATFLELEIPLAHLGGTPVENLFLDVRLLGLDEMGVAGRATLSVD